MYFKGYWTLIKFNHAHYKFAICWLKGDIYNSTVHGALFVLNNSIHLRPLYESIIILLCFYSSVNTSYCAVLHFSVLSNCHYNITGAVNSASVLAVLKRYFSLCGWLYRVVYFQFQCVLFYNSSGYYQLIDLICFTSHCINFASFHLETATFDVGWNCFGSFLWIITGDPSYVIYVAVLN